MNKKDHWEQVYTTKPPERLGWYKPRLDTPLAWIRELGLAPDAPLIDIGSGVSSLVDDLLADGYRDVTVLDISATALASLISRLGEKAAAVTCLNGDITVIDLSVDHYELWHDRAVLHFLTEPADRRAYRDTMIEALRPGGRAIVGAFAPEAPAKCSGLPVHRYDLDAMLEFFGADFELERHAKELHVTPGGVEQMYLYCQFRKAG